MQAETHRPRPSRLGAELVIGPAKGRTRWRRAPQGEEIGSQTETTTGAGRAFVRRRSFPSWLSWRRRRTIPCSATTWGHRVAGSDDSDMTAAQGAIRIGIGGWTFEPWRGAFYPKGLPHAQELHYAAERLTSIEVNGTFYRTQTPKTFRSWASEVPAG